MMRVACQLCRNFLRIPLGDGGSFVIKLLFFNLKKKLALRVLYNFRQINLKFGELP